MNVLNNPKFAAIDLGTNTFHLIVAHFEADKLVVDYRERHFVKIGEDGLNVLSEKAIVRAEIALKSIKKSLEKHTVKKITAYGTEALRKAKNGKEVRRKLESILENPIQLIDGRREAELITKGVLVSGLNKQNRYLIMDIGGGSVEFILLDQREIVFAQSFPIGVQVLKSKFHLEEPFMDQEKQLFEALRQCLSVLFKVVTKEVVLVGASGTFDVLSKQFGDQITNVLYKLDSERIISFYKDVKGMTLQDRLMDDRIPNNRADLLVVALGLIQFVIEQLPIASVLSCDYALKEGTIWEMHHNYKEKMN